MLVGARMRVDSEFATQVEASQFSRQEWSLIMTAVEFDVDRAGDAERARLVADTSKIAEIMPEVQRVADAQGRGMQGMGRPGGSGRSLGTGLLDAVSDALGLGRSGGRGEGGSGDTAVDPETISAAESLVDHYATELQAHLERNGRWEDVRRAAGDESAGTDSER